MPLSSPTWRASALGVIGALALLALASPDARAAYPGTNGKLAISECLACADPPSRIWTIDPDGSHRRKILGDLHYDPAFSGIGSTAATGMTWWSTLLDRITSRTTASWSCAGDPMGARGNAPLIAGALVFVVAALAVAILFDSPTSTSILGLMTLAAAGFSIYSSRR